MLFKLFSPAATLKARSLLLFYADGEDDQNGTLNV